MCVDRVELVYMCLAVKLTDEQNADSGSDRQTR